MPRGRPLARAPGSASSAKMASRDVSEVRNTRSTRSSSRVSRSSMGSADLTETHSPGAKRPRRRPSRASVQSPSTHQNQTPQGLASVPMRARSSLSKVSIPTSGSASSGQTPLEGSSDGYSTPGTSNIATPAVGETSTSNPPIKIEVQLPSRSLRNSVRSLKPASKQNVVGDSDEEDDFSDHSISAVTARRLQKEEDKKTNLINLPVSRRSTRASLASSSPAPAKRGRAATTSTPVNQRPVKKTKVIPDSDDLSNSDIDMDAEIAAGEAFHGVDELPNTTDDDDSFLGTEPSEGEEASGSDYDSEELPMKLKATISKSQNAGKSRRSRPSGGKAKSTRASRVNVAPTEANADDENSDSSLSAVYDLSTPSDSDQGDDAMAAIGRQRRAFRRPENNNRQKKDRERLEMNHPNIVTMWTELENMPVINAGKAIQPTSISQQLKPFQLEGLAWMKAMEQLKWRGGLLGDEMGLGKTIQAVSLIMSDYPAPQPTLVLVPPVALMQWQSEIKAYTDGTLKTFVFHGTNQKTKGITVKELKKYDVIMMSYNSLESMYRKQERGFKRKDAIYKERSVIHSIVFHRTILDEAHCIKTRTTMTAKACFALQANYRWCLTGTPLQNRIGEFFSLIRFLNIRPFAEYLCKQCPCSNLEWTMDDENRCKECHHPGMQHVSVFNQELLNPIQKYGNFGPGQVAFKKLRLMTERIMLRRLKKDHTNSMELPVKEIYVDRQFFGEEENDFANSIMTNGQRNFDTYVAQGVLLNNYANIFGLIMQMRQVADHPDLLLKKNAEGGQNVLVCCICDEPAEDTVRSRCKHDFCRACVSSYLRSTDEPDCPRCHIPLAIDLEQPEIEQDEVMVKKSSIINRIKMENWTSSSKIELLVHELHKLRSNNSSHKSIIFSQFTTMLQLIEWRLRRAGITTVMLDGSMTPAQRQASIEHFMNNVDVECFLVSLKAGGVALNLTEASRVFIVDPWWNPAAEWQSADRCHRIGQTRPCTITRLCIEDSVESRMVLIQEKKTSMIHSTVNGDDKAMESLTPEDMQFLFRGS